MDLKRGDGRAQNTMTFKREEVVKAAEDQKCVKS